MKLEGARQLPGSREQVWEKLNDPEVLQRCIPGCEDLEQVSPTELKATVALKIGPMNARFKGDVNLTDLNPPESYRIEGSGSGGAVGRASGGADVRLAEDAAGTTLTYAVDAKISGKIAQLGQRLIDATANQLADRFFDNFAAEFEPTSPAEREAEPAGAIGRRPLPSTARYGSTANNLPWYIAGAMALALLTVLIVLSF